MKKFTLLIAFSIIFQTFGFSQSCLPEGIIFTSQTQIDSFQINYPGCTEIEGDVTITGDFITNLNGINVLTSVGGEFHIWYNDVLSSLAGLEGLSSIGGGLYINDNLSLTNLSGLDNLTSIEGDLSIGHCSITTLTGLEGLTSIGGELQIAYNDIVSLMGLNNVTFIGGRIIFTHNSDLTSLTGLESLTSIEDELSIYECYSLVNLVGLDNVTSIGGGLHIFDNYSLFSLSGLDNVTSIGGQLWIEANETLTSLVGLNSLISLWGIEIANNSNLTSLLGLDNIDSGSINDLRLYNNQSLSTCEVQSICNYLASPNGTIQINNNTLGCNSQEEVEEACEAIGIEDIIRRTEFSIYPNPATNKLYVNSKNGLKIESVNIYNQLGQKVLHRNEIREDINISTLGQGIYIIELTSNELKIREKLVINE